MKYFTRFVEGNQEFTYRFALSLGHAQSLREQFPGTRIVDENGIEVTSTVNSESPDSEKEKGGAK